MLDLSKVEAGRLELEITAFDLGALLRALVQTFAPQADARGLVLAAEIDAAAAGPVTGDPLRLRQVVGNFLSNALKFTARGEVRLAARRPGGGFGVRIEVHDTGPGIEPQVRQRLFRPFSQADESTTRRFGGTGLGLSICRELATLMGGEVGVDSEPGRGSLFWVDLPLPPATLPAAPVPAGDGSLQGRRVLMVEDNLVNMLVAVAMLERWGVEVVQAAHGAEAVQAVREALDAGSPFDVVLMDVQMPVMSGYEATRILRALPGPRLPIVALTAAALVSEREAALAAGMDDFLTKPIEGERLRATLLRWCGDPDTRPAPAPAAAPAPQARAADTQPPR
jgi:CheY-like chemotaxis protein/anti-sigma regulatory factor (Ser/Thr protein kinase)